jgi:hypothetical protein
MIKKLTSKISKNFLEEHTMPKILKIYYSILKDKTRMEIYNYVLPD